MQREFLHRELTYEIIGAAMEVHRVLGPGFLEQVYQKALERELNIRGVAIEPQKRILVEYKGIAIAEYFLDLVVEECIVVELKAAKELVPVNEAQLISYLRATKLRVGLLFNFGAGSLQQKRLVV